jgi:PD-(D/E)XK nuclease superfamily
VSEFRGSSLPLLTKCAGSLVLPCVEFRTPEAIERARDAATWGTMVHHWKETGEIRHEDKRTRTAFEKALELSEVKRETYWPIDGEHEIEVSWRLDGSRRAVRGLPPKGEPGWMTGHIDYARYWVNQINGNSILRINDLKTAKRYYDRWTHQEVFQPDPRSPQLMGYGLALAAADNFDGPVILDIVHWPKLPLSERHSPPVVYESWVSPEEREAEWLIMENLYAQSRLPVGEVTLNPGPHCKFCPAQLACLFNPN